jgi:acyl-CoA hydrolase
MLLFIFVLVIVIIGDNRFQLLELEYNPVRGGEKLHTGYPVIVVAEIIMQVATVIAREDDDILLTACILEARNNKMIYLIAKYFSTILHELTVISTLQTNAEANTSNLQKNMAKKKKTPRESFVSMTELVLPNDTNTLSNLMGGRLMHWMDIVSAIAAQKHSNRIVVTASVDNISFKHPIRLGNVVTLRARVTRAFNSSMEVRIDVDAEDIPSQTKTESNSAYFTFVAVDQRGRPIDVPEVEPETAEDKEFYEGALRRRQLRLILAGRMNPHDANELKSIFDLK